MRRTGFGVLLVLIAAGACALAAFSRLHHDLAIDEPFTALAVGDPESLRATFVHDNVPLFYALLLAWTHLFGTSAFALRAMSTAAFAGAILFTAAAAAQASSRRAGWLTAILVGCSVTFGLQPAATARPYALAALFAAMASWAALRAATTSSGLRAALPLLAAHVLGLFTHPMFLFVSAASAVAGLTAGKERRLVLGAAPAAAVGIYLAAWGPAIRQTAALPIRTWMTPPGAADIATGTFFWGDHATPILAGLLVVLVVARRRLPARGVPFALTTGVLVFAGAIAASRVTPVYMAARTPVFVLPSIALVFGVVIAELAPAIVSVAAALLVLASAARYTARTATAPDPFPTREGLAEVARRVNCGDTIVAAGLSYAPVAYYARPAGLPACVRLGAFPEDVSVHPGWLDLSPLAAVAIPPAAATEAARLPANGRIWVFAQTHGVGDIHGAALIESLSMRRSVAETLPLSGSFFDRIVAFEAPRQRP